MKFKDIINLAGISLGSNKLRSLLTILGITIGVFSVVAVMTVLSAVRQSIDSSLNVLGSNVLEVSKYPAIMMHGDWRKYRNRPSIDLRQSQLFKKQMADKAKAVCVSVSLWGGSKARYRDRETPPNRYLVGTDENFLVTETYHLDYGRNLTVEDIEFARPVIILGYETVMELFPNESPLDKWISVNGARYRVVGVLKERGKLFGDSMDRNLLIPVTQFVQNHSNRWQSMNLKIQSKSQDDFETTRDHVIGTMRLVRGLEPENVNNFEVFSNDTLLDTFAKIAVVVGTGGFIISIIALVAAGVGIMNIMLVSVTERTREIGIRKSIGARSRDVLKQFLLEAIFLSEIGGLIGIIVGVATGNILAKLMNVPIIFPWFWAFVAVAICSIIGITFGAYPAWKAARLDPVEALRYE